MNILLKKMINLHKSIIKCFFEKSKEKKASKKRAKIDAYNEDNSTGCLIAILIIFALCLFPVGRTILVILLIILFIIFIASLE